MNQEQLIQKMEEELEDIKAETYYEYAKQGCVENLLYSNDNKNAKIYLQNT